MKEIKIEKCKYCGGHEFIDCLARTLGGLELVTGMKATRPIFTVCRDCKSIVRVYAKDVDRLIPKNERQ